jgi:hypothetical protein
VDVAAEAPDRRHTTLARTPITKKAVNLLKDTSPHSTSGTDPSNNLTDVASIWFGCVSRAVLSLDGTLPGSWGQVQELDLPSEKAAGPQCINEAVPTLGGELAERRCPI